MVKVKCIHCGEKVTEWANECPNCGKPVANPDAPTKVSEIKLNQKKIDQYGKKNVLPFILTGILAIIVIAVITYFLILQKQ